MTHIDFDNFQPGSQWPRPQPSGHPDLSGVFDREAKTPPSLTARAQYPRTVPQKPCDCYSVLTCEVLPLIPERYTWHGGCAMRVGSLGCWLCPIFLVVRLCATACRPNGATAPVNQTAQTLTDHTLTICLLLARTNAGLEGRAIVSTARGRGLPATGAGGTEKRVYMIVRKGKVEIGNSGPIPRSIWDGPRRIYARHSWPR